jgi:tRNA pseudouridine38-40 synthase
MNGVQQRSVRCKTPNMRNIQIHIEYDGRNYAGWQRQENTRTVQGQIETVLAEILQEHVNVIGAGRTDAGVHARGQIANFRTTSQLQLDQMRGGLNGLLPEDIIVHELSEAPLDFHARYSAKERWYTYNITTAPAALMRYYSWYVKFRLDYDIMRQAAAAIVGTHDFESFCRANADVDHHRCTVTLADWHQEGTMLIFNIHADRFLHGMIRTLVGTMVDVGRGYLRLDDFVSALLKKERKVGITAPARGLVLEKIVY